ncbi:MAG: helix-turn-helix domain-containing protein [Thermodesulfovibrio sp.]|uniref:helix-turn-helix domain-containing protein n=1 Tax=unclassified Thermodesulfovibrio TaxID=2645936 RepID=UPI00083AA611|nr:MULTISPECIES: helix-turn-helix domain-containing protein [unclassified Thermodesulfovibrio]MDI1471981.1 helix-turn-helix domain-containing protein [Thermodesulfovibrio sp. 1176]MDI6715005.1 helix-turn-helix domain-containing protein [Thermodesulfovibrio sp.]ODA43416.1 Transcriptional regulator, MerR family, near polyamine transporter [Thermodesulfovibrio sp. N1]
MQKISSGIIGLDRLIDYLYLGDNVVWEVDAGTFYDIFIKKFVEKSIQESREVVYINFNKSVQSLLKEYGGYVNKNFHIIDCFTSGKGKNDITFLKSYSEKPEQFDIIKVLNPSNLDELISAINSVENRIKSLPVYIFDSLTGMQDFLRDETATYGFFTYMCPRLFDLDSVAYWILEKDAHSQKFKANLRHITQVVLELYRRKEKFFIKALKLSRRANREAFKPHTYEFVNGDIIIKSQEQDFPFDIGSKIRELRILKNMSQKELAQKVNLTPGSISQIENNQIVPSIISFIQICNALGVKISDLLNEVFEKDLCIIKREKTLSQLYKKNSVISVYKIVSDEELKAFLVKFKGEETSQSVRQDFFYELEPNFIYILKGKVFLNIGNSNFNLQTGDGLYLRKAVSLKLENKGGENTEILLIKSICSF